MKQLLSQQVSNPFSRDSDRGAGYLNSTGMSGYELASFPTKKNVKMPGHILGQDACGR